jgi:hypothetical protein
LSVTRKLGKFLTAIVLTAFVCGLLLALPPFYPQVLQYPDVAVGVFLTGWFVAVPIIGLGGLVIGMPVASLLNTGGVSGYPKWAAAGAICGAAYSLLIAFAADGLPPSSVDFLTMGWLGIVPGGVAGLFWWRTVGRHEQAEKAAF